MKIEYADYMFILNMLPEDTSLKYSYETRYRTATVMEEDALNQPSAAGEQLFDISSHANSVSPQSKHG